MNSKLFRFVFILAGVAGLIPAALAIDHSNLDQDRPLQIDDAYPISAGEWAVETGLGYSMERKETDRGYFPIEVLYGPMPNLQVSLGSTLSTSPRELEEGEKSGDLALSSLYNFNQETLWLPAFGVRGTVNFPTGVRSSGVDFELKGLITKSFDRLSFHFNPVYEFLSGGGPQTRDGRYKFILGASYPIGAPEHTRTTLVADTFVSQSVKRGETETAGVEVGLRFQLTEQVVLDAGVGSELAGPADRSSFYATAGVSYGF